MRIDIERVFGASERLQPVTEAPASVTIVTAEEITRYGYRTLADILRSMRGFYVSNDRNYSYVGVRGIRPPGRLQHAGPDARQRPPHQRRVYDQAPIGADLGVDVAMFDRVEIIRGPASSLYGTSAFFAVVNVITRSGASLAGVSVDLDAGTLGTAMARISGGRRFANGVDLIVSGTLDRVEGDNRLYFPAFDTAATNRGVAEDLDAERIGDVYGRLTAGNFAFTAASAAARSSCRRPRSAPSSTNRSHPSGRRIGTRWSPANTTAVSAGRTWRSTPASIARTTTAFIRTRPKTPLMPC